ncbi:MAG TPA: hypothetical protein VN915_09005 [Elusimicrobiota bacterium]|nr:hypothetical protein [Elusimicrobiota bacterium]
MTTATPNKSTFLQRNKKKSALGLLLLFLREKKVLVLLVLLVFVASTVFISPSSWITGLPGGERFAAGVAWMAGKLGVDVSKWGLGGPGKRSYADLLEAFREAKASHNGGGIGWGPFFGHGGANGAGAAGAGGGEGSLGFVKGSKSDLDHGVGADGAGGGPQSVAGVVDPAEPKSRDGNAVTLTADDLGGQRAGYANGLNGNGFIGASHFANGSGPGGGGPLSGGAFANKGFFNGNGGAAGTSNSLAKAGLASLGPVATPASVKGGAAKGSLSAFASRGVESRATKGVMGAASLTNNLAFAQAAEGKARDDIGTQCVPPSCPLEYASTNSGAIYDGNNITSGFLSSSDPGAGGVGLDNSAVQLPPDSVGAGGGGSDTEAQQVQTCSTMVQQCQAQKTATMPNVGADQSQLNTLFNQLPGACGDPCNCDPCTSLENQINATCADMKTQLAAADAPCPPLPDYCAALGFTPAQFDPNALGQSCHPSFGKCGPNGLLGAIACLLGS